MPFNFSFLMETLPDAVDIIRRQGDKAVTDIKKEHVLAQQWLRQFEMEMNNDSLHSGPSQNHIQKKEMQKKVRKSIEEEPTDYYPEGVPSGSTIRMKFHKPKQFLLSTFPKCQNYPDLVLNGTNFLNNIITSLEASNEPYDMSDWEEEDAMKQMELDLDSTELNGKSIPSWAIGTQLKTSINRQNNSDGDRIFQSLARRCNLNEVFGTNNFKYYQKLHK